MMIQIEFLNNEFLKKTNENITHLIDHEYIKKFIFIQQKIHAKIFLYIYDRKAWIVKHAIIPIYYW